MQQNNKLKLNEVKGFIFDLDNTLVSSSLNFKAIKRELNCPPHIDVLTFVESLDLVAREKAMQCIISHELADAESCHILDGVNELLSLLADYQIPTAIVTRNCRNAARLKMERTNILIDLLITREDHRAKPSPDGLLKIAELWGIPPGDLIYVGDHLYDVYAAKRAFMPSCLFTFNKQIDYCDEADFTLSNPAQMAGLFSKSAANFNHAPMGKQVHSSSSNY